MNIRMVLTRLRDCGKQTLGNLAVFKGLKKAYECCTIEPPWLNNERNKSSITPGRYELMKRWSKRFGWHIHVKNVEGRTWILIHVGNYHRQTLGCILPGTYFADINKDGLVDVVSSRLALSNLLKHMPDNAQETVWLDIVDKI